ncbi:alginate lyase family protein [Sorangium sp. So ce887]|uniref:alginate lyase family protein n=1 Tax=Sorangium sp. So ce887 TaxID=3133324 RepID=UPI003F61151F
MRYHMIPLLAVVAASSACLAPTEAASEGACEGEECGGSLDRAAESAPDGDSAVESGDGDTSVAAADSGGAPAFRHPGVLVSRGQLDFVKAKIAAGQQPWKGDFDKAKGTRYGRLPYTPRPVEVMKCGNGSNPLDQGCTASRDDAVAAYTQTLIWYYTGNQAYADSAISILNAWSSSLRELVFDPAKVRTDPGQNNGPLQAAWLAELFPRSAELLRHAGAGWPESEAARFGRMLTDVLVPKIRDGWGYQANWNLSMADGMINIGIYNDDRALFDRGVAMWRERVPYNVYLASDGRLPKRPPGYSTDAKLLELWYGQSDFTGRSGHTQETCRDLPHTQMGLASTVYAAETAGLQGIDLYGEQEERIKASFEYVAKLLNRSPSATDIKLEVEASLCGGELKVKDVPIWELVYNHYVRREGQAMPESRKVRDRIRGQSGNSRDVTNVQITWEALTHADTGSAGYP